eukprot:TRINITY_DN114663_c0_g1_i1.p1 TRINITY_DN114663_c0_g1~~TRINITY_DN114663_c0_g1_i1.p1  ORF type:complete len:553 (-),score=109.70 TRINITY_DN114663_c0_g1_i1:365-2023(-)
MADLQTVSVELETVEDHVEGEALLADTTEDDIMPRAPPAVITIDNDDSSSPEASGCLPDGGQMTISPNGPPSKSAVICIPDTPNNGSAPKAMASRAAASGGGSDSSSWLQRYITTPALCVAVVACYYAGYHHGQQSAVRRLEEQPLSQATQESTPFAGTPASVTDPGVVLPGCCKECTGRPFCSPGSTMCDNPFDAHYCENVEKRPLAAKKQYKEGEHQVESKQTAQASCCDSCNGKAPFCSPVSWRCYDWKRKDYYHTCNECRGTRPLTADSNFTIVFIPDTQFYVMNTGYSGAFQWEWMAQADWVVRHQEDLKIKAVIHVGDLVEKADRQHEWDNFFRGWYKIEETGLPWSMVPGNHDLNSMGEPFAESRFDLYNEHVAHVFKRNKNLQSTYPEGRYENSVVFFEASGLEFMILGLELGPSNSTMDWAAERVLENPQKHVIINVHFVRWYLDVAVDVSAWAKQFRNVILIHQGHDCAREWHHEIPNEWGEPILEVLTDYQCSGDGYLRYYTFRLNSQGVGEVDALTYSPSLHCYEEDDNSQFSFTFRPRV